MFIIMAGGIVILAIIAVGSAGRAIGARRWVASIFWCLLSLMLLAWTAGLAERAWTDPRLLSLTPPQ